MTKPTLAEKTEPLRIGVVFLSATSVYALPGLIEIGGIQRGALLRVNGAKIRIPGEKLPSNIQFDPSVAIGLSKSTNSGPADISVWPTHETPERVFAPNSKEPMLKLVRKYYKKHLKSTTERKNHHE